MGAEDLGNKPSEKLAECRNGAAYDEEVDFNEPAKCALA